MNWALDEQQRILRDSANIFVAERMPVSHARGLRDLADPLGYDRGIWREFGTQGYSGMLVPEAWGGMGLGLTEAGIVAEALGRTLAPSPFLSTAVLCAFLLAKTQNSEMAGQWLGRIVGAETVLALAIDECARHRPDCIAAQAEAAPNGWVLRGEKTFVVDGHGADGWIVTTHSPAGLLVALVPAQVAGVTVDRVQTIDAHNVATLRLNAVKISHDFVLASGTEGRVLLDGALDAGRAIVACELLGLADEVFRRTVAYLKQRKQFGRFIGEFQALQHRAASLFIDLELTSAIVRASLQALDEDTPGRALRVAQAKARACLTANRAVQEAVQMHGGIGMTDELDIGLFMKRARVLQELFGDAAFQADRVAALSAY
jgi:alkylation response protein AidB-like acyl-CoA dehydrogenase